MENPRIDLNAEKIWFWSTPIVVLATFLIVGLVHGARAFWKWLRKKAFNFFGGE
jgi:hypothetical protein